MRVVIFCPQFAPVVGGAERQAQRQAAELVRQGVEVQLWTPRLDADSPAAEIVDGVRVHRFRLFHWPRAHWFWRRLAFLNGPSVLAQVFLQMWRPMRQATIAHCHMFGLTTLGAAMCARVCGKPVICKAAIAGQGSDIGELAKTSPFNRMVAPLGRHVFTRWIATTDAVAEELTRAGVAAARQIKIPNGIEIGPNPKKVERVRRFLYVGRLSTNINRDTDGLIRAFDVLAGQMPDAELAVVGGGDLLEHTRALVATLSSCERIQVPGFADPSSWLPWADCFVLPSRNEGLSNALLEAMERGLVCVANDIGPNREVLAEGGAGVLVPVGDMQGLCAALMALAADSQLAATYSAAARRRVEDQYSLGAVAGGIVALYGELARSS
jgi:glycosyltransferase involved in cell wall biosynthesis